VKKLKEFIRDAGAWGVASELASLVLYILGIVTVTKWGITFGTVLMLVGTVPLFWMGAFAAWNRKATELETEKNRNAKPEIVGEILHAKVTITGESIQNDVITPSFDIAVKLRITGKTNAETTLKDASLCVIKDGHTYQGERQQLDQSYIIQLFGRRQLTAKTERDLLESVSYGSPIRHSVASEGWLRFFVQGLDVARNGNVPVHADLAVTLTDELGGQHVITATDILIRPGY
jgi:hypothetical protein